MVEKQYDVILADPPWRYTHAQKSRRIENHYPTMGIDDICSIDVPAANDCVLFLWATAPKLVEALRTVNAWGFEYKTCAVWDKEIIGMGYYFRGQHELLLIGRKGTPGVPSAPDRYSSVITARRGKHSEKPKVVYGMIERMYPSARKIEMFARTHIDGWDVWGNEAPQTIQKRFQSYTEVL